MNIKIQLLCCGVLLMLVIPTWATQYTWDASGGAPLEDGAGSWAATGGTNWLNGTTSIFGVWGNATTDEAIFGVGSGAAGTITVGTVNANKITFNAPGSGSYLLSGGTITLGGTAPKITANVDATISSVIAAGTTAWTKDGTGTLTLNGANTGTGNVTISGGTVRLGTSASLLASATAANTAVVTVNGGATLAFTSTDPLGFNPSGGGGLGQLGLQPARIVLDNGTLSYESGTSSQAGAYGSNTNIGAHGFTTSGSGGTLNVVNSGVTWTIGTYRPSQSTSINDNIINNGGLTITGAGNVDIRKYITGTGGVTINGTGILILGAASPVDNGTVTAGSRDNTYAGNTTITSGTLQIRGDYAASNNAISIAYGAGKGDVVFNAAANAAILDLNGRSININGLSQAAASTTNKVVNNGTGTATLTLGNNNATATFAGILADNTGTGGTLALTKVDTGTQTLSGANTYTGGTTISQGSLLLNDVAGGGTGTITLGDSNTGANNVSLFFAPTASSQTVANDIVVSSQGMGTATIGTTSGSFTDKTFSGSVTLNRATTLTNTVSDRLNFSGAISGNVGTLTISGNSSGARVVFLGTSAHTFVGDVIVDSTAVLQLGLNTNPVVDYIPDASNVTVNGTLNLSYSVVGGTETINALSGSGTVGRNGGSTTQVLAVGSANGSGIFSGVIGGSLSLTKLGTGTQTLSGANTYSGTTTVSAGALQVGSSGSGQTGTGAVTVQSGGTILGSGVIQGSSFTAESGSTVQAGDSTAQASYGTLTFTPVSGSGSFDFQSGSSVILGINPGSTSDKLVFTGTGTNTLTFNSNLKIGPDSMTPTTTEVFDLLDWSGLTGSPTFGSQFTTSLLRDGSADNGSSWDLPDISGSGYFWDLSLFTTSGTIAIIVPEPGRCVLLLVGWIMVGFRRRR